MSSPVSAFLVVSMSVSPSIIRIIIIWRQTRGSRTTTMPGHQLYGISILELQLSLQEQQEQSPNLPQQHCQNLFAGEDGGHFTQKPIFFPQQLLLFVVGNWMASWLILYSFGS
jgi:hypothetical protein